MIASGRPAHFKRLPDGVRCRCIELWQDADGSFWCCGGIQEKIKAPAPQPKKVGLRAIEITFAEPVELDQETERRLIDLALTLCYQYEAQHPGRVMWPFGIGFKPTFIPMTREQEQQRGIEFADDVFQIECAERADYKAKCAKCGMEQGDHKGHITDPPAGDCDFTIANG